MSDLGILLLVIGGICAFLVGAGILGDWFDAQERRDARRRNRP